MGQHGSNPTLRVVIVLFTLLLTGSIGGKIFADEKGEPEKTVPFKPENSTCFGCHGYDGFSVAKEGGGQRKLYVSKDAFYKSVHAKRNCVDCHTDIIQIPHRKNINRKVGCISCHQDLWHKAKTDKTSDVFKRLDIVVKQIDTYMASVHAKPNIDDQSRTNATCHNCHTAHYIYPADSKERLEHRLQIPQVCGKCHSKQKEEYYTSVHGQEVSQNGNLNAAVCIDCHTTSNHDIDSPKKETTKVGITKNCGGCHDKQLKTYMRTYHGQVNTLGYGYTAKCYDCHGHHTIKRVNDPLSTVHSNNRLNTCRNCHKNATPGYITFKPHGNTHDFENYPNMWIASKFMIGLLAVVFTFFWSHAALWFYREYKERKERTSKPHVDTEKLLLESKKYYRRFGVGWRLAHLALALGVMLLVLTGMTILYADSFWAPTIMHLLGGPANAAMIHRFGALTFMGIFFGHLLYFIISITKNRKSFKWFGPKSLLPNWQDFYDARDMFKWFFNKGKRPIFDRWAYWEKFDYWAPFWGLTIVGVSGLMMWFPEPTAAIFPGWIFNIATIIHGEEAFLAAVFLFTVHYFNSHFRPDKFPQDIVMFTGAVPLEEFKREHTLEYRQLVENNELEKYLVDAPSYPMTIGSKILGATLIFAGLGLLLLVLLGFWGNIFFG